MDNKLSIGSILTAVIALGTAYFQYAEKKDAQNGNVILIEQQNKLLEKYEEDAKNHHEEIKRYQYIASFLDSSRCTGCPE